MSASLQRIGRGLHGERIDIVGAYAAAHHLILFHASAAEGV
jgi:hypothetical protein